MARKKTVKKYQPLRFLFLYRLLSLGLGEDKDNFIENLSMLLAAGMDILAALEAVKSESRSFRMRYLITALRREIDNGSPLWEALQMLGIFPIQAVALIRLGERSGRLVENLRVIVLQQKKERNFHSKISSAMMYPAFVLGITAAVALGITWFILPQLSKVFSSLDVELPWITKLLIGFGNFISLYGSIVIPAALAILFVGSYIVFAFPPTKFLGQYFSLGVPGINKLIKQAELARFGYVLGTLLGAGLPVIDALDSLAQSTEIIPYRKLYRYLQKSGEEGNSFRKSFSRYRRANSLVPQTVQQLIAAGEQSGSLPQTFLQIGENYEARVELTSKNIAVILEPLLLFIVWLAVLGVAIAIILPIYSLVGSFKG